LAKLILNIIENHNDDNIILSVPESDEISIKDIAYIIAKCFNYENYLIFYLNFSDGQYKKKISPKKLLYRIPDFQFTNINDGIQKTVKWFIENYGVFHKLHTLVY